MTERISHRRRSDGFVCRHCKRGVSAAEYGTRHRNHCPWCLWSLHVDNRPGDRGSSCRGSMEPIAIWARRDGEWAVIHRCTTCGNLKSNRIAGDDNPWALMGLAASAISQPPFPLG